MTAGMFRSMLVAIAVVCLSAAALWAQLGTGAIVGTVHDESGASVPAAGVTVTHTETGISRTLVTDTAGRYSVPGLLPGGYEIQAQAPGFQTAIRRGIQLTVGSEPAINLVLQIGQVSQTTIVTADAPLIETVSSSVAGLVGGQTIVDLPLNGRSFDQLIALQSGVSQMRLRGGSIQHGTGAHFSVAGARGVSNIYLLDGTEMIGGAATSSLPGGAFGTNMGVEAVQEFQIVTSNYTAVYGKKAGGVVNIATKSGTNTIHGSVYEFLRNDNFDARNFFDPRSQPPEFKRNQFGAAVGGPIRREQTFYFGNVEVLREILGTTGIIIVPDDNARLGILPTGNVAVAPAAVPFLTLFPRVNGRSFGDGNGEYLGTNARVSNQEYFLTRVDHKITDNDFLFGRYNFADSRRVDPATSGIVGGFQEGREQVATAEWKRTSSTIVNSLRVGFSRGSTITDDRPLVDIDPSLVFLDAAETVGQIVFGAASTEGVNSIAAAGTGNSADRWFTQNQYQVADQVFYQMGAHALQFGGELQRIQNYFDYATSKRGEYEFPSFTRFLQGLPNRFRAPDPRGSADAVKGYRRWYFSTYMQDDWKATPRLTLNLGLRYEVTTVPIEMYDRISNFRYKEVNGWKTVDTQGTLGSPFWDDNWLTFAPRVGFAWDPTGGGTTSIRGGFGMFYDQIEGEFRAFTQNNVPFFGLLQVDNPPFPRGFAVVSGTTPRPAPDSVDAGLDVPTRQTWNFSAQHQLNENVAITGTYVGSQAYHLTRRSEGNGAFHTLLPDGRKFFAATSTRRNPLIGANRYIPSDVNASYQSFSFDLNQRFSRGVRYKVAYTFAKNLDYSSSPNAAQTPNSTDTPQDPQNPRADKALSSYDIRNNFSANLSYDVPALADSGVAQYILGGWRLGSILTLSDGLPFTITTGYSRSRDQTRGPADRPNRGAGSDGNPILGGPDKYFEPGAYVLPLLGTYGNVGRNTLVGPGLVNVDLNLEKVFSLGEGKNLNFRTEVFNLFNRANFGIPDPTIYSTPAVLTTEIVPDNFRRGAAGRINNTITTSRQLQFALKFVF
ncbi:MAG: TonB-dependent receptor [Acidobacteria bacterium]|nr:TonB-dependent receptor [Acidobacteriota bacterium]